MLWFLIALVSLQASIDNNRYAPDDAHNLIRQHKKNLLKSMHSWSYKK